MKSRGWWLLIAVVGFGMLSGLPVARADVWVGTYCATLKTPKGCSALLSLTRRCFQLDCFLETTGKNSCEGKQEYRDNSCNEVPQCEYSGPSNPSGKFTKPDVAASPCNLSAAPPNKKCHPSYTGVCITPGPIDVDCNRHPEEIPRGNGPRYVWGPFKRDLSKGDPYGLDTDNDGKACEYQPRDK
jgi:hypothetical protein